MKAYPPHFCMQHLPAPLPLTHRAAGDFFFCRLTVVMLLARGLNTETQTPLLHFASDSFETFFLPSSLFITAPFTSKGSHSRMPQAQLLGFLLSGATQLSLGVSNQSSIFLYPPSWFKIWFLSTISDFITLTLLAFKGTQVSPFPISTALHTSR